MIGPFILTLSIALGMTSSHAGETLAGLDSNQQDQKSVQIQPTLDDRIANLSQQITDKIEAGQKKKIAVLEFTDLQGNVTDFGRYLAEELITRLYDAKKFKVIERQLLNKVINEQKLSLTGMVDPASAKKLGSILGVDAIVSGTIADRGQSLKVNARLVSAETGEIFSAAAVEMAKDQEVTALMKGGTTTELSKPGDSRLTSSASPEKKVAIVSGVFTFELQACKLSGDELSCSINVTNNSDSDRKFNLFGKFYWKDKSSSALDSSAREYSPDLLWIGNSRNQGAVSSILAPGVPVKIVLAFKDVTSNIVSLNFLRVTFNEDYNSKGRYADFRNVPVVR